jgi:hypothetical protein
MAATKDETALFRVCKSAASIHADIRAIIGPPEEGLLSESQLVLPMSIVRNTRGYLEKVTNQINGCYERAWYDGCAVMIRRLIETLIIEVYEHHNIANRIKGPSGDFLFLRDLIDCMLNETTWNLSRNTKKALPKLKDVGDKSAHSRRYLAHRSDIDKVADDLRVVAQEFVLLAALK